MRKYQVTSNESGAVIGFVEALSVFSAINEACDQGIISFSDVPTVLDFFSMYEIECVDVYK